LGLSELRYERKDLEPHNRITAPQEGAEGLCMSSKADVIDAMAVLMARWQDVEAEANGGKP
jgi:hypothetical protein